MHNLPPRTSTHLMEHVKQFQFRQLGNCGRNCRNNISPTDQVYLPDQLSAVSSTHHYLTSLCINMNKF